MPFILEFIKAEDKLQDLIAKSNGENVRVNYGGTETTLATALASICSNLSSGTASADIDQKISAAIDKLIDGAPAAYDTLKKIADYIAQHDDVAAGLTEALGQKVDKVSGKGLSTEDFTTALKTKLESLPSGTATQSAAGLMSAADKAKLDTIRGVRYGTTPPSDMQEGELFIRIVP